ncbi:MAG TPA: S8 family serine peptidase [Pyrinomonadaceae bacterium]|jgi:subtilisin family serine protease|nr:S8 family serine peptidase [Pyrinomonadaceae bacterium]
MKLKLIRRTLIGVTLLIALAFSLLPSKTLAAAKSTGSMIGINVLLKTAVTDAILADLGTHGKVRDVVYEIKVVTVQAPSSELNAIRALPYVAAANPDAERNGSPVDTLAATDFTNGMSTWDLDAVNITDAGSTRRQVSYDGTGVYVAVLDTGLLDSWRQYFPQQRIAVNLAKSFSGGGGAGTVSETTNQWEHDQNSHGTHVTSTILGYSFFGTPVNGVAPKATVIPVKVLNQSGFGWSSVIAHGIVYIADLKAGQLAGSPVVINMSLGGGSLDAVEKAAIDYAVSKGVIIVASAGNEGNAGMGYPGAYQPVISVAASGWTGEWLAGSDGIVNNWWWKDNVADPTNPANFYITDFSSRQKSGQDLDVAAPGSWTVGPYQVNSGQLSYFFLGGTSMASPHVAGIAALMAQKNHGLTAAQAESILTSSAIYLAPGCRNARQPDGSTQQFCWGADATGSGLATADKALKATP